MASMSRLVGAVVGDTEGDAVGALVVGFDAGDTVGSVLGLWVGCDDGDAEGSGIGAPEGAFDGVKVGDNDGAVAGDDDGACDCDVAGDRVGLLLGLGGDCVSRLVGAAVGDTEGDAVDALVVGFDAGDTVGSVLGLWVGCDVGDAEGSGIGAPEGAFDGVKVGDNDGAAAGDDDGACEGGLVSVSCNKSESSPEPSIWACETLMCSPKQKQMRAQTTHLSLRRLCMKAHGPACVSVRFRLKIHVNLTHWQVRKRVQVSPCLLFCKVIL